MEWWTHARTVHSYTEVEEYQPITQSHTTRREREENHSHSLLPPTFSLISLSLYKLKHQKFHPAQTFTRACTQTHTHTHCEQDRKINTDHGASCFGPITPLWCRMWGDSWQETLSHSHASQNDKSLSFSHPSIPRARALSLPLSLVLSHRVQGDENDTAQKGSLCKLDQRSHHTGAHPASPSSFANPCVMDKTTWPELVGWKEVLNAD